MQGHTLTFHTPFTSGDGLKGQLLKLRRCKWFFVKLSTKTYLTDVCYDLNNTEGELRVKINGIYVLWFNINVLQQTACLVVNPITVGNFAFLFNCTPVGRTSDSLTVPTERLIYWWDDRGLILWLFVGPTGVYLLGFFCSGIQFYFWLSPYLCFISLLYLDLYILGDDALIS